MGLTQKVPQKNSAMVRSSLRASVERGLSPESTRKKSLLVIAGGSQSPHLSAKTKTKAQQDFKLKIFRSEELSDPENVQVP